MRCSKGSILGVLGGFPVYGMMLQFTQTTYIDGKSKRINRTYMSCIGCTASEGKELRDLLPPLDPDSNRGRWDPKAATPVNGIEFPYTGLLPVLDLNSVPS